MLGDSMRDAIDIAIDRGIANSHKDRGDEAHAHVGDLGFCRRQTWARRNGKRFGKFDTQTLFKFWAGLAIEAYLCDRANESISVLRDLRIAMWPGPGAIDAKLVGEEYEPTPFEMIGHPDGVTDDAVIEVKSTEFFKQARPPYARIPPTWDRVRTKQRHYVYQVCAYALALKKPYAVLIIVDRASLERVTFRFDPREFEDNVRNWMVSVLADTMRGEPEPEAAPPEDWQCAYCRYYACEENVNPQNDERNNRAKAV